MRWVRRRAQHLLLRRRRHGGPVLMERLRMPLSLGCSWHVHRLMRRAGRDHHLHWACGCWPPRRSLLGVLWRVLRSSYAACGTFMSPSDAVPARQSPQLSHCHCLNACPFAIQTRQRICKPAMRRGCRGLRVQKSCSTVRTVREQRPAHLHPQAAAAAGAQETAAR